MPFKKGNAGKPKGSKNKSTKLVEEMASEFKLHPFQILMMIACDQWEELGYESSVYVKESKDGAQTTTIGYVLTPEMRLKAATEATKYLLSQKKAVEISTADDGFNVIIRDYTKPKPKE